MNYRRFLFLLAIIAIEFAPLLLFRWISPVEKTKMLRAFTTVAIASIILFCSTMATFPICFAGKFLPPVALMAFHGTFPFTRWIRDILCHFPRWMLAVYFLLFGGTPWLLSPDLSFYPSVFNALKIVTLLHLVIFSISTLLCHDLGEKIRQTIILLGGLLPALLYGHRYGPFFAAIFSQGLLLLLLPRRKVG
jgi:hypothetical protein